MVNIELPNGFKGEVLYPGPGNEKLGFGLKLTPESSRFHSDSLFNRQYSDLTRGLLEQFGFIELKRDFVLPTVRYFDGEQEKTAMSYRFLEQRLGDLFWHRDGVPESEISSDLVIMFHQPLYTPEQGKIIPTAIGRDNDVIPEYIRCLESLASDLADRTNIRFARRKHPGAWNYMIDFANIPQALGEISYAYRDSRINKEALGNALTKGIALLDNYFSLPQKYRVELLLRLSNLFGFLDKENGINAFYASMNSALEGKVHWTKLAEGNTVIFNDKSILHAIYPKDGETSNGKLIKVQLIFR